MLVLVVQLNGVNCGSVGSGRRGDEKIEDSDIAKVVGEDMATLGSLRGDRTR